MCWLDSSAWPTKNAANAETIDTTPMTTLNTASLAHRTGSRFGTTVRDARIMPVAYSPLISSTPSTPTASCEMLTPLRLRDDGVEAGVVARLGVQPVRRGHARRSGAPSPTVSTTDTSRVM